MNHALLLAITLILAGCADDGAVDGSANEAEAHPSKSASPDLRSAAARPENRTIDARKPASAVLGVDSEGLRFFDPASGASRALPFGTPRAATLEALSARPTPETSELSDCSAGPLVVAAWPDGLGLVFQDEKLAGWSLDKSGGPSTASGIAPGSTRAELDAAYKAEVFESTIGTEFIAGELFGLLDGKGRGARITFLWGGISCLMR